MFVSPFTVSLSCDATVIVVYLQRPELFGGTIWLAIEGSKSYSHELADIVWLAILRIVFLLPHVLPFVKRRRLSCPLFQKSFVIANAALVIAKAIAILVEAPRPGAIFWWWLLVLLSAASVIAQWGCLYHLRSSMPNPRYKTIFIGSKLNARLLGERYGADALEDDSDEELASDLDALEAAEGGHEEAKGRDPRSQELSRRWRERKKREPTAASASPRERSARPSRARAESTRELVDFFAARMQEARDAWSGRVQALQKRWQASFLRGDWRLRGGGRSSAFADRDASLRLTFGLIVRMYAYEDTLNDLRTAGEQDESCLEAFAPQFVSFLVWDSYYMSGQLEAWLLARCEENLYFAHALEFQLRASCLPPSPATSSAEGPSSGVSLESKAPAGSGIAGGGEEGGGGDPYARNDVMDKVGRRAVELLLNEIAEKGEIAARRLVEQGGERSERETWSGRGSAARAASVSPASATAPSPAPALAPPPTRAWVEAAQADSGSGDSGGREGAPLYEQTIDFLTKLAEIAASLTPLSKAERTASLKRQLDDLGKDFFASGQVSAATTDVAGADVEDRTGEAGGAGGGGSQARAGAGRGDRRKDAKRLVYVPIGDRRHRVVALHPSDSFAFSTRERAPCFVCLEVVGARGLVSAGRATAGEGIGGISGSGDGDSAGQDPERGSGGEGVPFGRAQSLRQWIPGPASLRSSLRLPARGRDWILSLGRDGETADDDKRFGGGLDEEEAGAQRGEAGGGGYDRTGRILRTTSESGAAAKRPPPRRRGRGMGEAAEGRRGDAGGSGGGNGEDDYYRLLVGEGRGGSGGGFSLSDAREWWAADGATGRAWNPRPAAAEGKGSRRPASEGKEAESNAAAAAAAAAARGVTTEARRGSERQMRDDVRRSRDAFDAQGGQRYRPGCPVEGTESTEEGEDEAAGAKPNVLFKELWRQKSDRFRRVSPWADEPGWRLLPVIVKSNDDLRQEQLASQLLSTMQRILRAERVRVWMRPYDIVALSADTGIIEAVPDTISLDALRKYRGGSGAGEAGQEGDDTGPSYFSLTGFFEARFGDKGTDGFRKAQRRFIESLAAYSIACYLLQIKDRHNGNILLDAQGRIIHIDFGFMLQNSPGGNLGFESAPFKLTQGFINLMGGTRSRCFRDFRGLCVDTFLALRRNSQEIVLLVEMMASGNQMLPCFQGPGGGAAAAAELAARFQPDLNDPACEEFVKKLVRQSAGSWTTGWYDKYQRFFSGIY